MHRPRCAGASRAGQPFIASGAWMVHSGPPACARRSSALQRPERPRVRKSRRAIIRSILEDLLDTRADGGPAALRDRALLLVARSEEHTSELQSLMRISYAVFCLKKKKKQTTT